MAGGITEAVIEEIKARIDLADLISSYGIAIRTAGASQKACCPFHHEKTPSFNINANRGFYHCFGCGESGDAIKFVMKMEGLTFVEAAKKLAERCGMTIEEKVDPAAGRRKRLYALMAELAEFYHRCLLKMKEAEIARDYLMQRALDLKTQQDYLIGYAPNGVAPMLKWAEKYGYTAEELEAVGVIKGPTRPGDLGYHRFSGRLMFTIKDKQGRVVAFSGRQLVERKNSGKYVNSPETVIFKKSNVLFGFDRAAGAIVRAPHREVICCEGQIDTIRLQTSGFATAVGSQGTAFTEEHARMIKRVADAAVLMYDDDTAGRKATIKVAGMLLAMEMPVRVVALPNGDDPDSYLRAHAPGELQELIDGAESIVSFQCRVERDKEANPKAIDAITRVSRAVLATLAACPSAILRASLVDEAAKLLGLPVAALTEELSRLPAEKKPARIDQAPVRPEPSVPEVIDDGGEPDEFLPEEEVFEPDDQVEPPAQVTPPTEREFALMAFLMANEFDTQLDGMLGEFLPPFVFIHPFTGRFVEVWRSAVAKGEDLFGAFADSLDPVSRNWFDRVLLEAGRTQGSGLSATAILQDFVRTLWADHLRRERGNLPANGDVEAEMRRMKISMDLKRLAEVRWNLVKEMVREWIATRGAVTAGRVGG